MAWYFLVHLGDNFIFSNTDEISYRQTLHNIGIWKIVVKYTCFAYVTARDVHKLQIQVYDHKDTHGTQSDTVSVAVV